MDLQHLFLYDHWANREEVAHLRRTGGPQRAIEILAHIVGTESLWLGRIRGNPKPAIVWPKLTLDECRSQIESLREEWKRLLTNVDLDAAVDYTNSKGERWTNTADDILMHVVLHGGYHRGQIATIVRGSNNEPAYTDF